MLSNCNVIRQYMHPPSLETNCTHAHALQQVLGLLVDIQHAALGVLREVKRRHLGHELILPLTLLLLQPEGNTTDGTTLNTLHQVGGVTGDLR